MKNCGEQVRYSIKFSWFWSNPNLRLCPMAGGEGGGGTWWLVTEPILTEGGELQSVVTSEDGKMRDFGQIGPD